MKNLSSQANLLVLWLDCDREGEAIGYEVIDTVKKVNRNVDVLRAHFSAVTTADIKKAMETLTPPDQRLSDAVEARQEIDLRIGASFTRFQSLNFRHIFGFSYQQVLR